MIARDEADTLPAMAEACRGLIDSWCIVMDRRTRDDTWNVANRAFSYAPGSMYVSDLTAETFDFARARNEALAYAREPGVHLMFLDPDTPPVGTPPEDLSAPVYVCDVRDEKGWTWQYPVLVDSAVAVAWHLPAHEYLEIDAPAEQWRILDDLYLKRSGAGATTARTEWAVDVLRRAADEGDADSPRAMFYLGQMLGCLERYDEALEAFIRRVGMDGGSEEERFFSFVRIGQILIGADPARASRAFLDAYALRPGRAEPLFYLSQIAAATGNYEMSLVFANQGLMIPPTHDSQFVMRWVEEWGMRARWAIAADALGLQNARAVAAELVALAEVDEEYRSVLQRIAPPEPEPVRADIAPTDLPNWFEMYAHEYFERHLSPGAGHRGFRALQIGCFTGNASVWLLENVVKGDGSLLDDVDTWEGSEDIHGIDFAAVEARYDAQTAPYVRRRKHKMASAQFLHSLPLEPIYDFAYIDGDHTAVGTLEDAVAVWPRLKVGGLLAFDDYAWRGDARALHCPYPAIDAFMALYKDRCVVLEKDAQVWIRKLS